MPAHRNGHVEERQERVDPFILFDAAITSQQEALRAALVMTETMRLGSNHIRRQMEYVMTVGQTLASLNGVNAEFVRRMTTESAESWKRTADMTAGMGLGGDAFSEGAKH